MRQALLTLTSVCLGISIAQFLRDDSLCHVYLMASIVCFNGFAVVGAIGSRNNRL